MFSFVPLTTVSCGSDDAVGRSGADGGPGGTGDGGMTVSGPSTVDGGSAPLPPAAACKAGMSGSHWLDLDWLFETFEREHPLDRDTLLSSPVKLVIAATSVDTGAPVYLEPQHADILDALKGSCAIPILYRSVVRCGEHRLSDGGVAAPIPVEEAYRRGARRLLVIRSRPASFVKRPGVGTRLGSFALRGSPALAAAFRRAPGTYAAAVSFLENPPEDCSVVQVAPAVKLRTGRVTRDLEALAHDYGLGRELGLRAIESWSKTP